MQSKQAEYNHTVRQYWKHSTKVYVQSFIASAMVKSELRLWFAVPGDGHTM